MSIKKIVTALLAISCMSFLNADGLVITVKKGSKEQKVKPLDENVKKVNYRKPTSIGWTVDDKNKEKKKILKGDTMDNPELNCH